MLSVNHIRFFDSVIYNIQYAMLKTRKQSGKIINDIWSSLPLCDPAYKIATSAAFRKLLERKFVWHFDRGKCSYTYRFLLIVFGLEETLPALLLSTGWLLAVEFTIGGAFDGIFVIFFLFSGVILFKFWKARADCSNPFLRCNEVGIWNIFIKLFYDQRWKVCVRIHKVRKFKA